MYDHISWYVKCCNDTLQVLESVWGWFKYCKSSISGKKRHSTMCGIACPPPARIKKGMPLFCQVACNCWHSTVSTLGWRLELEPTNLSESNMSHTPCQANFVAYLLHQVQPAEATFSWQNARPMQNIAERHETTSRRATRADCPPFITRAWSEFAFACFCIHAAMVIKEFALALASDAFGKPYVEIINPLVYALKAWSLRNSHPVHLDSNSGQTLKVRQCSLNLASHPSIRIHPHLDS